MLLNQVELLHRNEHSSYRIKIVCVTSSDLVCQPPKSELESYGPVGVFIQWKTETTQVEPGLKR